MFRIQSYGVIPPDTSSVCSWQMKAAWRLLSGAGGTWCRQGCHTHPPGTTNQHIHDEYPRWMPPCPWCAGSRSCQTLKGRARIHTSKTLVSLNPATKCPTWIARAPTGRRTAWCSLPSGKPVPTVPLPGRCRQGGTEWWTSETRNNRPHQADWTIGLRRHRHISPSADRE